MTTAISVGEAIVHPSPQGLRSPLHPNKRFPQRIALAVTAVTTSQTLSPLSRSATDPTKPSWAFKTTIAKEIGASESTVYRGLNELAKAGLIERLRQERKSHNGRLFVSRLKLTKKACACLGLLNTGCKRRYSPNASREKGSKGESQRTSKQVVPQEEEVTALRCTITNTTHQTASHAASSSFVPSSEPYTLAENSVIENVNRAESAAAKQEGRICRHLTPITPSQQTLATPISSMTYTTPLESGKASVEASQGLVIHKLPSVNLKDGQYNTLPLADQKQSIKKQSGQPRTFSVKIANRRIPSDLAWLVRDNYLSVTGLLYLMETARRMGHFLSDIVKMRQSAIRPHTGRTLYAYLRALITKPVDYVAT